MCQGTANLVRLQNRKGSIAVGYDADLCVWDPNEEYVVKQEELLVKNKISPYVGERLFGVVKQTYVHGKKVFERTAAGTVGLQPGHGKLLIHGTRKSHETAHSFLA